MEKYKILTVLGRSPGWINAIPDKLQDWFGAMHEEYLGDMKELEKEWHEESRKKDWLREWKSEPGKVHQIGKEMVTMQEFAHKARVRYLRKEIKQLIELNKQNALMAIQITKEYAPEVSEVVVPILAQSAEKTQRMVEKYGRELEIRKMGAVEDIPLEMIMRAKDYPIEQIITVGRNGRAKCVFHEGENDNMDIRKNFAYCYKCNESGDAIKVYMKVHDCTFKQAVKALV